MSGLFNPNDAGAQMAGVSAADMAIAGLGQDLMMEGVGLDGSLPMDLDSFGDFTNVDALGALTPAQAHVGSQGLGAGGMGVSAAQQQEAMAGQDQGIGDTMDEQVLGKTGSADGLMQKRAAMDQQENMTGAGAGPLPTGFGITAPNSSTLTEFTKRRNWSQRIIEELKDFLHILTPDGRILYVSPSCKHITGYEPHNLIGKFIGEYVHPDDSGIFMREFNESIASGNSLRFFYRFKKDDGTYIIFECDGHPHISPEPAGGQLGIPSNASPTSSGAPVTGVCRGFFMMARPYPTKNAALLDSFLEHKIENERLMKRIEELKREEMEENAEQERLYREQIVGSQASATPSETHNSRVVQGDGQSEPAAPTPNYQGMPPPAKPSISNTALTRQNLDSALSAQKPDSIADKMSRYEASSNHLESIELLTGLRYRDGERSHGISTGDTSPALIRGDAGIAILLDRDRDGAGKKEKKKLKVADEYVCADCGTLDSPEWRKGPKGPKTLCNACGLRWAKKEKKRSGDDGKKDSPGGPGSSQPPSLSQGQSSVSGIMQGMQGPNVVGNGGGIGSQHRNAGQPPGLPMGQSTGSS